MSTANTHTSVIRTNSDHEDFKTLIRSLDQELWGRYGAEQGFFDQFNKTDKIHHVVVAYADGMPVGCGAIKKYSDDTTEVKRMFVKQNLRGKGIARLVLTELERWASELNYAYCILQTGYKQPDAVGLYQKAGYKIIANYGQYVGTDTSVCMKKQIR
jgi:GNAT superfamily N-acetyltransferase